MSDVSGVGAAAGSGFDGRRPGGRAGVLGHPRLDTRQQVRRRERRRALSEISSKVKLSTVCGRPSSRDLEVGGRQAADDRAGPVADDDVDGDDVEVASGTPGRCCAPGRGRRRRDATARGGDRTADR